ncbi:MAG TPA: (Fe-S)-binding protein [Myxococcaceae bacterium]|nr:(Fe-S)-binding protein [Myxococcaceae bacterium]
MEVALFIPCYVDQFYPNVGLATVDLLERYGAKVEFPEEQTCCGQPMANSGCFSDAAPLAKKFLAVFSRYQYIVCPSGSCTSMVRNHYATLLPDEPELATMRGKVYELCEFLHDVLRVAPKGRFPHRVGLHQSCHGLRELRLASGTERRIQAFDKVRDLLSGLDGIQLVELARPDECCGFGGTFAVAEEAISCAMGKDRIADHQRAGAEIIAGADMSCLMHLSGLSRREKKPLRVMHVAELLAEATA